MRTFFAFPRILASSNLRNRQTLVVNVPGTVNGRDSISVGTSMLQKSKEVVSGDDSSWDDIIKGSHFDNRVLSFLLLSVMGERVRCIDGDANAFFSRARMYWYDVPMGMASMQGEEKRSSR